MKSGKVSRGVLGVTVQPVSSDIAASLGLKDANGVIVSGVQAESPAERAGLKQGDVIIKFNGASVSDSNSFRNRVAGTQPGTGIALTVLRNGREQELTATLGERTSNEAGEKGGANNEATGGRLGVQVKPVTPELAAQLRLAADTKGLVVRGVDPEGVAAEAGIRQGDVILAFNRRAVTSSKGLRVRWNDASGRPALMLINRQGNNLFVNRAD